MRTVHLTYRYRLYPTREQIGVLESQLAEACRLYNAALQERRDAWRMSRTRITYYTQSAQLKDIRAAGDIGLPSYHMARNVLQRVNRAFEAFFRRCRHGERPGYPRFRSARRYDSLTYPQYRHGCRVQPTGRLHLHGIGELHVKWHRPLRGTIKAVTVKREGGHWFVCFTVAAESSPLPASAAAIGVDVGLTRFATLSDGTVIENPRHTRRAERRLRLAQRRLSRRRKGSQRRRNAVRLLQRAYIHLRNQRADFHHKESRKLVGRYGFIAIEDLNVQGLARGSLARSVHNAAWTHFIDKLAYKAANAGRELVKVDPRGTSQLCVCGTRVPKTLKDRWHHCPTCGLSAARDQVSAQVILIRAGKPPSGRNVEERVSCVS